MHSFFEEAQKLPPFTTKSDMLKMVHTVCKCGATSNTGEWDPENDVEVDIRIPSGKRSKREINFVDSPKHSILLEMKR